MANKNTSSVDTNNESLADRASSAFGQFSGSASDRLDNNPLIALAGGIAVGALLAALLPQTDREAELLQPVGSKVTDAGRAQFDKVREAGKAKVDEFAGDKLRGLFSSGTNSTGSN